MPLVMTSTARLSLRVKQDILMETQQNPPAPQVSQEDAQQAQPAVQEDIIDEWMTFDGYGTTGVQLRPDPPVVFDLTKPEARQAGDINVEGHICEADAQWKSHPFWVELAYESLKSAEEFQDDLERRKTLERLFFQSGIDWTTYLDRTRLIQRLHKVAEGIDTDTDFGYLVPESEGKQGGLVELTGFGYSIDDFVDKFIVPEQYKRRRKESVPMCVDPSKICVQPPQVGADVDAHIQIDVDMVL